MRAVLIGTDLMYQKDGKLVPIEINTNVGWDGLNRLENLEDCLDIADLEEFAINHGISNIFVEGDVRRISLLWPSDSPIKIKTISGSEMESIEDSDTDLVIRTAFSPDAYVDSFCRDKIKFLTAIGTEYILKENGKLIGKITSLENNGICPNIVVKYRYPYYDINEYPKVLNFKSLKDLQAYAESELEEDYFMMPFYYNSEKIYSEVEVGFGECKRLKVIRNWSIFVPTDEGTLENVQLGYYTKLTGVIDESKLKWNSDGTPKDAQSMLQMFTSKRWIYSDLKDTLLDVDDVVLMEDGTWKAAQDLQEGDKVKALSIPTPEGVDIRSHTEDYNISLEDWKKESEWVTNEIISILKVETPVNKVFLEFTDGTDWYDTAYSSYPCLDDVDDSVKFVNLRDIKVGDRVILLPVDSESQEFPTFELKEVANIREAREVQRGYSISLDGNHLFLSKASDDRLAYIAIEHNADGICLCADLVPGTGCQAIFQDCKGLSIQNTCLITVGTAETCECTPEPPKCR